MDKPLSLWVGFFALVAILVAVDLGLWHRKQTSINVKESLKISGCYFLVAILFGLYVLFGVSQKDGEDFFTGYFIEESLSMDNIFVMSMIFSHFKIPRQFQHRVLFWGILGAV